MTKVIIIDDHPVVRFAVKMLLEKNGVEVVAETDNGIDAIQASRQLAPDLVLLDIGLPKIDGLQVLKRIRALNLPLKIVVFTSQSGLHLSQRCRQAGANGFVTKTDDLNELLDVIKMVMRGYSFFPEPEFPSTTDKGYAQNDQQLLATLSDREMSVLIYIAKGFTNKKIGEALLLSEKTISTYKVRIKMKLNAESVLDLFEFADRNNLLE